MNSTAQNSPDIGDEFVMTAIYHDKIGGPEPHRVKPGVVRHVKSGKLYLLELLDVPKSE